ncbi:GNAT family N-acetyltransferase [Rhizobium sp. rho-13.1]|nr:GNAT family N-acetyltransferase [Rhizobium sp. rho-13.1]TQY08174.1 GNAT family N-acetyltransferase [Rhizobium sp. rho-1.1]
MIRIFVGHKNVDSAIMEKIWRFRHQQFVEGRGWEAIRKSDGRESDEFDHETAIHFVVLKSGAIVGYSRLLPTTQPHLLSHVYPQIMQGHELRRSHDIFEWTRCAVGRRDEVIGGVPVSRVLMVGVLEFCRAAGISSLIVQTHPKLINSLLSNGWEISLLAQVTLYDDQPIVPLEVRPSSRPTNIFASSSSIVDDERDRLIRIFTDQNPFSHPL